MTMFDDRTQEEIAKARDYLTRYEAARNEALQQLLSAKQAMQAQAEAAQTRQQRRALQAAWRRVEQRWMREVAAAERRIGPHLAQMQALAEHGTRPELAMEAADGMAAIFGTQETDR